MMGCNVRGMQWVGVALVLCLTGAVLAGTTTYSGDTTGDPTWNRIYENSSGCYLSSSGTAVSYETQVFSVSVSGTYTITSAYDSSAYYDGYLYLYEGSFDSADPFTNFMTCDDDYNGYYYAQIADVYLEASVCYVIVNSGFDNEDYGTYTTTIAGRGEITLDSACQTVPVPTSLGLVALGCLSLLRRRRR